jgi:DNA-binding transcriptional LysR family regulator
VKYDGFKNITFQQMEAFVHLIEDELHGRRRRCSSPSALTKHIKNLERC